MNRKNFIYGLLALPIIAIVPKSLFENKTEISPSKLSEIDLSKFTDEELLILSESFSAKNWLSPRARKRWKDHKVAQKFYNSAKEYIK